MNQNNAEIEIDLMGLIHQLRKKIVLIAVVTVVCTVLGLLGSILFITPQYTATTRIYVINRSNENTVVSSDFQIANYMVNDYQELIKGRNVTAEVIAQLGLDMGNGTLASKITVSSPSDTRILQITVQDPDPEMAAKIANAVREETSTQLTEIMQVDSVKTIYEAEIPTSPSSPNVMKNGIIMGILGFVAVVGILSLIYVLDDRIRNEDDVERYLDMSTLGVIPDLEKLTGTNPAKQDRTTHSNALKTGPKQDKK